MYFLPLQRTPWPNQFLWFGTTLNKKTDGELDKGYAPVFPEVGSMTTLCPGMSLPSRSATSTIRFAILSFTDPPAETYSSFPTETSLGRGVASVQS